MAGTRKLAPCHPKTVSALATRLKHFGVFLTDLDPDLTTLSNLDRRRHIEPWLAALLDTVSEKDGQPISIGDRNRRVVAVATFLTDITERGWDAAPTRKVIFRDDIPKLPQVLPRYLPVDADRRLSAALAAHPDDELTALALRLQRACGLRIGELLDLELDCDVETLGLIDRITQIRSHGRPMPHPRCRRPAQFLFTYLGRRLTQRSRAT